MLAGALMEKQPADPLKPITRFCEERRRLRDGFLQAVHELNTLQTQQTEAIVSGDTDFSRFDILIHMAQEKKDAAKYAWIAHVETHNCEEETWH